MAISSLTTKITNKSIKLLSGLANNSDSIMPMLVKDTISNAAIVDTYKKEGGKDDATEKAIEEFGTGAIWLLAIPAIKKIFDKTIYPFFNLDSNFDTRLILDKSKTYKKPQGFFGKMFYDGVNKEAYKNIHDVVINSDDAIYSHEKEIINSLADTKISKLYKTLFASKFLLATAISAVALVGIIRYKQKITEKRIEKDFYQNNTSKILLDKKVVDKSEYQNFTSKNKKKQISFTGMGSLVNTFAQNPILNTSILDCVITGTRLKEARHGERKEVFLKEFFQIIFIYGLAKPIQLAFEKIGKLLKAPIELDPKVLFDKDIKIKLPNAVEEINQLKNLNGSLTEKIFNFAKQNQNSALIQILEKNETIPVLKDKMGNIRGISALNPINEKSLEKAINQINSLNENIKNLNGIKAFKIFAVVANIAIAAWAMGRFQPKVAIWMRKKLNNGDNRNPSIVAQEKAINEKYLQKLQTTQG